MFLNDDAKMKSYTTQLVIQKAEDVIQIAERNFLEMKPY